MNATTSLKLTAWTHPTTGEIRIYLNGSVLRTAKIWIGRSGNVVGQDWDVFARTDSRGWEADQLHIGRQFDEIEAALAALDLTPKATFAEILAAVQAA